MQQSRWSQATATRGGSLPSSDHTQKTGSFRSSGTMPTVRDSDRLNPFMRFCVRRRAELMAAWEAAPATTVIMTAVTLACWTRDLENP